MGAMARLLVLLDFTPAPASLSEYARIRAAIPAARSKNGNAHIVHLSDVMGN
jgi:hypothetical protein